MDRRYEWVIGIDPDVDKNGVALLNVRTRDMDLSSMRFFELLDWLRAVGTRCPSFADGKGVVVIEAGWLNRSNWHVAGREGSRTAQAKGNAAGRNHEVGRKIVEMCRYVGIPYVEQRPLTKCWSGPDRKITHDELAYFTGVKGRTNQEERDAALLAWVYSGLPVTVRKTGDSVRKTNEK